MIMESERKCSHCGNSGHNSRTCNRKAFKLFGVKIAVERCTEREDDWMKSYSMGNFQSCALDSHHLAHDSGYLYDDPVHTRKRKAAHERKKGIPWTEEEHRIFLEGLEKLGKGDWSGISKKFVTTRTPIQVASHAQKYFLRRQVTSSSSSSSDKNKKRRPSLFDMPYKESTQAQSPKGMVVPLPAMVPFVGMTSLGQGGQQFAVFKAPQTQSYGNLANCALNINSPQFLTPCTYSLAKSPSLMSHQATEGAAAAAANASSVSSSEDAFLELRLGPSHTFI